MRYTSDLLCEHANEMPRVSCGCALNCACRKKRNTCAPRPVGRPPEGTDGKVRQTRIEVTVSRGEFLELDRAARGAGLAVAAYVRARALAP